LLNVSRACWLPDSDMGRQNAEVAAVLG